MWKISNLLDKILFRKSYTIVSGCASRQEYADRYPKASYVSFSGLVDIDPDSRGFLACVILRATVVRQPREDPGVRRASEMSTVITHKKYIQFSSRESLIHDRANLA